MGYGEQQRPPTTALYRLPVRSLRCAVGHGSNSASHCNCCGDLLTDSALKGQEPVSGERKKVLIVEDALVIRMAVAKFVADFGHDVIEAADGQEGLIAAPREHPDLIISDVHMPKMDGMEFVTTLHQDENMREVPIVMLTGEKNIETIKLAMKSGVNDYILKDISNPSAFRDRLKKYL
ncbi:MAG: two-component system chemotaxis response regulator CheY [Candidatus Latescibacterota bacterium]|jgi:two-component system chemotaxis response regulator CheY